MKNKRKREYRAFEARADSADAPTKIEGYAAVFGQIAHGEMIKRGAFAKTLDESADIKAYWSHQAHDSRVLGRTGNGTLELDEDENGLRVVITPNPDTTWGADALASIARGDVDQMSFGFAPIKETLDEIDGEQVRILHELRLYEVSPVAEPWYSGTSASARDIDEAATQPEPVPADHSTDTAIESERKRRQAEMDHMDEMDRMDEVDEEARDYE